MKLIKTSFLIILFLGLVLFNIATLISDKFHGYAFAALSTVLGGSALASQMFKNSPTLLRKSDKAAATKMLTDRNKALTNSNRNLKENNQQVIAKNKTVRTISERMTKRTTIAASRNIASIPGQAIPLVGTGLIIGVTTWDIYDYCENLKDIKELNNVIGQQVNVKNQKEICGWTPPTKEEVMAEVKENWQGAYDNAAESINEFRVEIPAPMIWEDIPELPPLITWPEIREKYYNFLNN